MVGLVPIQPNLTGMLAAVERLGVVTSLFAAQPLLRIFLSSAQAAAPVQLLGREYSERKGFQRKAPVDGEAQLPGGSNHKILSETELGLCMV